MRFTRSRSQRDQFALLRALAVATRSRWRRARGGDALAAATHSQRRHARSDGARSDSGDTLTPHSDRTLTATTRGTHGSAKADPRTCRLDRVHARAEGATDLGTCLMRALPNGACANAGHADAHACSRRRSRQPRCQWQRRAASCPPSWRVSALVVVERASTVEGAGGHGVRAREEQTGKSEWSGRLAATLTLRAQTR